MNLIEDLQQEIIRNKELLNFYESIPQGKFGATFIKNDIDLGEKAIKNHDSVLMVGALKLLRNNE